MTDPTESLLRDVLTEDAAGAPLPGDLGGAARTRLRRKRRRQRAVVGTSLALVALAGGAVVADRGPDRASVRPDASPEPSATAVALRYPELTGHRWQLVEAVTDGRRTDPGAVAAMLGFDGAAGQVAADICNHLQGPATFTKTHVTIGSTMSTAKGCQGVIDDVERVVHGFLRGRLAWTVEGDVLRLTAADGDRLVYRAYAEPDPFAGGQVLMRGTDGSVEYGLAAMPGDLLRFAVRTGPSRRWLPYHAAAAPPGRSPLRDVLTGGYGDRVFVGGWATADTTRVVHVADYGAAPVELTLYAVEGGRKAFGGFVQSHSRPYSKLTLHRADGSVIAEWP